MKSNKVLILRKVNEDLKSNNGTFQYPEKGFVSCPDWNGKPKCGGGLHGLLWGQGNFNINGYGSKWQVIEVDSEDVIELTGKCKFKQGVVLLTTNSQLEAITLLKAHENYPVDNILNFDITDKNCVESGYCSIQKAGDWSTQKAGDWSTQKAGDRSTQKAGDRSTQKAGPYSTQTAGINSVQIGYWFDENCNYHVATRIVTEKEANKPYLFKQGIWT
jgi:hypothetical protein